MLTGRVTYRKSAILAIGVNTLLMHILLLFVIACWMTANWWG